MNSLEIIPINFQRLVLGSLGLIGGFWLLTAFSWAWWALLIGGGLAWLVVFQRTTWSAFRRPHRLWTIPLGAIGYLLLSLAVGLLAKQLGFNWSANPESGHLAILIFKLPLMLMGEELLGIGILEVARNQGRSLLFSTLISALIFGLMHAVVYWDGDLVSTFVHVIVLQGMARLIFNGIYLATGKSLWGSWSCHLLVDLVALSL